MNRLLKRGIWLLLALPGLGSADTGELQLGQIRFSACDIGDHQARAIDAWCTRFEVAEDPARPQGRRISLDIALVPARSPKPQPDLLVFLAGGPGQAAIEAWPTLDDSFRPLLRDRHLLLVDQRGTGGSNRLACDAEVQDGLGAAADDQDPLAAPLLRQQAQRCLAGIADRADPRQYTTSRAIADLELIRVALGSPAFNLIGGSYGTRVALSYLQAHPASLRSLILDGVVPQDEPLGQGHARNLDDALGLIFAACREDRTCAQRFGDPAATLAGLRRSLRRHPQTVTVADPLTGEPRRRRLDEATLATIVRLYAYAPESAALLPLLIDEAAAGRPQALIAQGLIAAGKLGKQLAHGMELSVICAEDAPELRIQPGDEARLIGNFLPRIIAAQCPVWPTGSRPPGFKQPVVSDKPVLLLSGEWDPVTPPRHATIAARTLSNSRQLVAKGQGHVVLRRGCAGKLAARFIDELQPKTLDAACLDSLGRMPAFISALGPAP
jgi:pimeloyl-ACP methyl ester carboxylesterase